MASTSSSLHSYHVSVLTYWYGWVRKSLSSRHIAEAEIRRKSNIEINVSRVRNAVLSMFLAFDLQTIAATNFTSALLAFSTWFWLWSRSSPYTAACFEHPSFVFGTRLTHPHQYCIPQNVIRANRWLGRTRKAQVLAQHLAGIESRCSHLLLASGCR